MHLKYLIFSVIADAQDCFTCCNGSSCELQKGAPYFRGARNYSDPVASIITFNVARVDCY